MAILDPILPTLGVGAHPLGFFPVPFALLGAFLVLSASQPAISARYPNLTQPCLFLQTVVIAALILTPPLQDFYALLFLGLGLVATKYLPYGRDILWLGIFCVVLTAALLVGFGPAKGVTYFPIYVMGVLFLGLYGRATRRAEEARKRSEDLLAQLRVANRKLRLYAERAEEAATIHERKRTRLACRQDPERLPALLEKIKESSADSLAEMRALVSELIPRYVTEGGLVPTLRQHFVIREHRERLRIHFLAEGEERGDVNVKEALFRAVQEALNNIVKHAGVDTAEVALTFQDREVILRVRDAGRGFDPAATADGEGFGLASMRDRVESRGGTFQVTSSPGAGAEITIRMPLFAGGEQNGQEPSDQGPGR